jgi:hypothetical protein
MEKPIRHPNNAEAPKGKLQPFASDRGRRLGAISGSSALVKPTRVFSEKRSCDLTDGKYRKRQYPLNSNEWI